jgi:hypothetical protein
LDAEKSNPPSVSGCNADFLSENLFKLSGGTFEQVLFSTASGMTGRGSFHYSNKCNVIKQSDKIPEKKKNNPTKQLNLTIKPMEMMKMLFLLFVLTWLP